MHERSSHHISVLKVLLGNSRVVFRREVRLRGNATVLGCGTNFAKKYF